MLYLTVWGVRDFMAARSSLGISMIIFGVAGGARWSGTECACFTS